MGALVFVTDEQTNGCAESDPMLNTRLKMNLVLLIALGTYK